MILKPIPSSFRDPNGFLFERGGNYYRLVSQSYAEHYDLLMTSGLYQDLTDKNWLIKHSEDKTEGDEYKILFPEQLQYVSYPYEWCFSQLKDAAALTLDIQLSALDRGMTLKDASAFNVQLHKGNITFIDTLSFERYEPGTPWIAYRQYCQHFLAPLALIAHRDFRVLHLLRAYIDGIPLDLASKLLPWRTWLNYGLLAHIHLHAMTQQKYAEEGGKAQKVKMSKLQLRGLIESLKATVAKLNWDYAETEWGDYYSSTNYVDEAMDDKEQNVSKLLKACSGKIAADFGANTGRFSRLAACDFLVLSHDIDEVAVDRNYAEVIRKKEDRIHPLLLDLTNPSPGLGWANEERTSFVERKAIDVGLALALIHHIAISNNVPLHQIAQFFHSMCRQLIIEFVPKEDTQVIRLLTTRKDIFPSYNKVGFEEAFKKYFTIKQSVSIKGTERTLYLMSRKTS